MSIAHRVVLAGLSVEPPPRTVMRIAGELGTDRRRLHEEFVRAAGSSQVRLSDLIRWTLLARAHDYKTQFNCSWREAAELVGCDLRTLRHAARLARLDNFPQEAGGSIVRRFEQLLRDFEIKAAE